jgi:hypothetical protein
MNHLTDDQLTLLYYGEDAAAERAHADSCDACRTRLSHLAQFMDALRAVPVAERAPDWDRRLWNALSPEVSRVLTPQPRRPFRLWVFVPALATALAVVFFAGMYLQHRVDLNHPEAFSPNSRERVLLIALGDHLDRSQIVLAELAHAPDQGSTDISAEQQLAARLLGENRLLRQTARHAGDSSDAALLEQLERVLLDIAHAPTEVSSRELKELQDRIAAQGLLFKVRVVSGTAREKGMKL